MINALLYEIYKKIGDGVSYFEIAYDSNDDMIEIREFDGSMSKHKKIPLVRSNPPYGTETYYVKFGPIVDWVP